MKKLILFSTFILIGLFSSFKSFAQSDLFINNTTSCSYTVDIYWTDGAAPPTTTVCDTSIGVNINAYSNFTVTNPTGSPSFTGTAVYVVVYDNTCLNTPIIGDCSPPDCWGCSYVSNYIDNSCTYCGSPLHFQFIPKMGGANAQLYIHN